MKMPIRKPVGRVADMEETNFKTKFVHDSFGVLVDEIQTRTLRYPANHPRARYKKFKREYKKEGIGFYG